METFQTHKTLNKKLFSDGKMKPDIREHLQRIINNFLEYLQQCKVPIRVVDEWLVGSNASYNYQPDSDIDIHIIVDVQDLSCDESLLKVTYDLARSNYNKNHDITVKGYSVEIYIEDVETTSISNGIYSIKDDKWVKEPEKLEIVDIDVTSTPTYNEYMGRFNKLITKDEIQQFIDDLYILRKLSLSTSGEFGEGNLVFKEFRSQGLLDDLKDRLGEIEDSELTLECVNK